jgi:hypothetical protein
MHALSCGAKKQNSKQLGMSCACQHVSLTTEYLLHACASSITRAFLHRSSGTLHRSSGTAHMNDFVLTRPLSTCVVPQLVRTHSLTLTPSHSQQAMLISIVTHGRSHSFKNRTGSPIEPEKTGTGVPTSLLSALDRTRNWTGKFPVEPAVLLRTSEKPGNG